MNQSIGQQFAVFRYEKNSLVVEETASAGGCGSFNAASSCPVSYTHLTLPTNREV